MVPVKDYLSDLAAGRPVGHLNGSDLFTAIPTLRDDIKFPDVGPFSFDIVWVGATGNTTPIHFDRMPNVFAQIVGTKRWRLWSPKRKLALASWQPGYRFAKVDGGVGPEGAGTPDVDLLLEPGDMLLVPVGWWHHVVTMSSSVSVNRWWAFPKLGKAVGKVLPARTTRRVFEFARELFVS